MENVDNSGDGGDDKQSWFDTVAGWLSGPLNAIGGAINSAGSSLLNAINSLPQHFSNIVNAVINLGSTIINGLINGITSLFQDLIDTVKDIGTFISEFFEQAKTFMSSLFIPEEGYMSAKVDSLKESFSSKWAWLDVVYNSVPKSWEEVGTFYIPFLNGTRISFAWYEPYRHYIKGFFQAFLYVLTLLNIIKQLRVKISFN